MNEPTTSTAPKPSSPLIVCSWIVIAGCIVVGANFLGTAIARWWNPFALGGVFGAVGALVLGAAQYCGTFRHHRPGATLSMAIEVGLGAFIGFALVANAMQWLGQGADLLPAELVVVAVILGVVGAFSLYASWLNRMWRRQLTGFPAASSGSQVSLREMLGLLTVVGLSLGIAIASIDSIPPRYAEHLETDSPPFGIPPGAKDICFAQGGGSLSYEFNIDEAGYRAWAKSHHASEPQEIRGEVRVYSYRNWLPGARDVEQVKVTNGLACFSDRDLSGSWYVYDRQAQRAYYHYWSD
jgi:hypothetical protein